MAGCGCVSAGLRFVAPAFLRGCVVVSFGRWLAPLGTVCRMVPPALLSYPCVCRVGIMGVCMCRTGRRFAYCSRAGISVCRTGRKYTCRRCARRGKWSSPHLCIPCMRSGCDCARISLSHRIACTSASRCRGDTYETAWLRVSTAESKVTAFRCYSGRVSPLI